ncbi:DNA polymerase III subunit gamma/tau, partial [bacterium]|nr:DNA polymerase III subunit gamma/tau [bacterium]
YLFSGPRGIGKTSTARILAKALNCVEGPTSKPCNKCSNCIEITESRSIDVMEIDGASNRGIDEIRNLRENVRYVPVNGKYKIYIIDEVHMLTTQAFNALLKTLEEPPESVVFIFATTQPFQVPATILSRCQRFDFKRIPLVDISSQIKRICETEKVTIDDDALLIIAKKADGAMRDAQSILDQVVSFSGSEITTENVTSVLGLVEQELFFDVTDTITSKDLKNGLSLSQNIINRGYDLEEFFAGLLEHFRNILVAKITGSADLIETSDNFKKKYIDTASHFSEDDVLRLITLGSQAEQSVKKSSHPALRMETALLKMIRMDSSVSIENLLKKINDIKNNIREEP